MHTLSDVQALALELLRKEFTFKAGTKYYTFNARSLGYTFQFDNAKRRFGCCHYRKLMITLSRPLCEANLDKLHGKIKDTILHEIAHAFCVQVYGKLDGRGHDWKWKQIAKEIGCDAKRCYDSSKVEKVKAKYTLSCPNDACDVERGMHRKPKVSRSCAKCSGGSYNPNYKMIVKQNY